MFISKLQKVENGLKLNVLFTIFVQIFLIMVYFHIISSSIEQRLTSKYSADQILAMKSEFVSFDLLRLAIRSFSNN